MKLTWTEPNNARIELDNDQLAIVETALLYFATMTDENDWPDENLSTKAASTLLSLREAKLHGRSIHSQQTDDSITG